MALQSPIHELHARAGAMFIDYGVEPGGKADATPRIGPIPVVGTYGELALEYAALRRNCVLIDLPQRGVIEVRGPDAAVFLNRMLTQELKDLPVNQVRRSFWLNRKGRIDADVCVLRLDDVFFLELDALATGRTLTELTRYVVMEEVEIHDRTPQFHCLSVQGPTAPLLLERLGIAAKLEQGECGRTTVAQQEIIIFRNDICGVPGLDLLVPVAAAAKVYHALMQAGHDDHVGAQALRVQAGGAAAKIKLRPAGWHALNIARIEAGTPLYNLDFGPDSLPAQTGIISERVSFTKGCYLGQEIVARMHSRGNSKPVLVALQLNDTGLDRPLPDTGAAVRRDGEAVGSITSFTYSPILGAARIGFAMMKLAEAVPNAAVTVDTQAVREGGTIRPRLAFLPPV